MKQRTYKRRSTASKVISVILILIILACIAILSVFFWKRFRGEREYERLRAAAVTEGSRTPVQIQVPELPEPEPEPTAPPILETYADFPEVDFGPLWATNEDVCAWIRVPGTIVDYPVMRNEDTTDPYDNYYLDHTIDHVAGLPGSVYMQPCNSGDFSDYNTVLYGHDMKNGSIFGTLHRYDSADFLEENHYIYVVTPEKRQVYEIASAVFGSNQHIMFNYEFEDPEERQDYLEELASNEDPRSHYRDQVSITAEDHIITLSTCVAGEDSRRFLVTGVLIAEEEVE